MLSLKHVSYHNVIHPSALHHHTNPLKLSCRIQPYFITGTDKQQTIKKKRLDPDQLASGKPADT